MILDFANARDACREAIEWIKDRPGVSDYDLWRTCPRGDWLLWLVEQVGADRCLLVHAACDCVESVLHFVPEGEERPRLAIEAARRWADNPTTARREAAALAALAAALAAEAVWAVEEAAERAAEAALAAAWAAERAAWAAAWAAAEVQAGGANIDCATIVRRRIPWATVRDKLREVTDVGNRASADYGADGPLVAG